MQNYVLPNPGLVTQTRDVVRAKLAVSLHHLVFEVFGPHFTPPMSEDDLRDLTSGATFPNPAIFALHGALVNAALNSDTDDVPELFRILKDIASRNTPAAQKITATAFGDTAMHRDDIHVLGRVFADDVGLTTVLKAPSSADVDRAKALIDEAVQTLGQASGAWVEELHLLANQVYFAVSDSEDDLKFGGAAVFDAFGAILMNPMGFHNAPTVLMALVHEASHQQMFLFHLDDPILLNDADAAYTSPLRLQPRPMEGIFHALWVSARMVAAAQDVLKSIKSLPWAEDLRTHQARALDAFRDCEKTVAEHAQLTDLGAALFADARAIADAI